MPREIETRLQKMINSLVWDGNKAPINMDTMNAPPEEGGISLLDIKARNEAIQIMWLKKYTTTSPDRPMWALVADVLQSWSPITNATSSLPPDIKKMLNTGRKYGLRLDALRIPEDVKRQLPAWYHLGAENNPVGFNRMRAPKCLKTKHQVMTVGDLPMQPLYARPYTGLQRPKPLLQSSADHNRGTKAKMAALRTREHRRPVPLTPQ